MNCLPFLKCWRQTNGGTHQLAKLFKQSVNKINNTPNSVAPPRMSPTRQAPQARAPVITPPAHNAHPNRPNIIEDDHGNQTLGLDHGNQPLRLGLPPQQKTATPHHIPPDYITSPRVERIHHQPVTPSPRVERLPRYQTRRYNIRTNTISARYVDAANYISIKEANAATHPITGQAQEYRHPIKGEDKNTWETSFAN